jgi:hypothetical protein
VPYVVKNANMFTAAFAGACAGMGVSGRVIVDGNAVRYVGLVNVAASFAQALDTVWGAVPVATLEVQTVQEACEAIWQDRSPLANESTLNPATWNNECRAIVAIVQESLALYAANGWPNPPISGGGGGGEDAVVVPFAFDSGVVILQPVTTTDVVYRADILIENSFNGASPTIEFGTLAAPGAILSAADSNPTIAGQYESLAMKTFSGVDILKLSITPNGATRGNGRLLYELRHP